MADIRHEIKQHWNDLVAGDPAGFRALHDLTYDELFRYAHRLTRDRAGIRDALQEVYVAIWQRRDKEPPVREPWVFLLTALRNKLIDAARKKKDPAIAHAAVPSPEDDIIAAEAVAERTARLAARLAELPERQREALHLRYRVELEYDDIAKVMGVGRQVAYNYVNRGVKALRKGE